jgi:hypothetical protein
VRRVVQCGSELIGLCDEQTVAFRRFVGILQVYHLVSHRNRGSGQRFRRHRWMSSRWSGDASASPPCSASSYVTGARSSTAMASGPNYSPSAGGGAYVSFEVPASITVDAMTTSNSERDPQADWLMLGDAVDDLLAGLGDPDGFRAAFGALRQAASSVDHQALLNTPQLPEDAGEYRKRLAVMLARIPDGWGRWISCSRGWYPIICELDEQLARLFPAYRIHQVKEKYASLRYYWEAGEQLTDPADPEPEPPAAAEDDTGWSERWDAWRGRQDEYTQTPEGQARAEDARLRGELAKRLVDAAEARASVTCELCGQEGSMRCTCAPSAWYQTLCEACAAKRGMVTVAERNAWWEAEQPRFEARLRAQFIDDNGAR